MLALALILPGAASPAPFAGTTIDNQASATFVDGASGLAYRLTSNVVQVLVQQVSAFTLSASQSRVAAPGGTVIFQHALTNTGNGTESFTLAAADALTGGFGFSAVALYSDANNDGIPDNFIPITGTGPLAPGAVFRFVVAVEVPGGAAVGSKNQLTITASGTATPAPASAQMNVDTVAVSNFAVVNVLKSFSAASGPSPFAGLTVTFTYTNVGTTTATNVSLADVIGANNATPAYNSSGFSYVPNSGRWSASAAPLSDAAGGDPAGISYEAVTAGGVTTVRAVIAALPPGASGALSFQVDVKPGLPPGSSTTQNAATVSYHDGVVQQAGATNNTVFYTVVAAAAGPDLQLNKSHVGNFTVGMPGDYTFIVRNAGTQATNGAVTVTDTLHNSLNFSATGSGGGSWRCSASGQTVSCTSIAVIAPGQVHPDVLTIRVIPTLPTTPPVTPSAAQPTVPAFTNTATVSGGGEAPANNGNNGANDPTLTLIRLPSGVSGRVWQDINHDRKYDSGEPLLPGWIVELRDASNAIVRSAITDANGAYSISGLVPGPNYRMVFRDPSSGNPITGIPVNGEYGTPNPNSDAVIANGIIQSITLMPGANITEQSLPLDPSGVVYNAISRQPVAGAQVALSGPSGFDPAAHLVGGASNVTQTTGPHGYYQFILLAGAPAGIYALAVTPPAGYQAFPSTLIPPAPSTGGCAAPNCLDPTGLATVGTGYSVQPGNIGTAPPVGADTTYYLRFNLNAATDPGIVNNHLPVDPLAAVGTALLVQKGAARNVVEPGDFLDYTVRVQNASTAAIAGVTLSDALPFGFIYVRGSARLGGVPLADPPAAAVTNFALGTIPGNTTVILTYRVRVGAGAERGDGTNRAQAASGSLRSNVASVKVRVNGGVFSDKGYIFGKIYLDCNGNGVQDAGELGIPGVRLFLEDGTHVISDVEGKYTFYGLKPRTHVLKLDRTTLPPGARLVPIANRNARDAGSRFVDLTRGELHRADFAEGSCAEDVVADVRARREKGEVVVAETERALRAKLNPDASVVMPADPRGLPASGTVGGSTGRDASRSFEPLVGKGPAPAVSNLPASPVAAVPRPNLDQLLPDLDNRLGFVGLRDRDTLPIAQTHVVVKGAAGTSLRLNVNGETVSERRVGRKLTLDDKQLLVWEYIGIDLRPGENTLEVAQVDPYGNVRETRSIVLTAPDQLGRLAIEAPPSAPADGFTPVRVKVRLTDSRGVPVTVRTPLTLDAAYGRWQVEDLDKTESGVQVFVEGGAGEFTLLPPQQPGDDVVRISSGALRAEHRIAYLPELRQMIGAGVIEGALNLRSLNLRHLVSAQKRDGFEEVLDNLASPDGRRSAGGRAALFLKGKVKGEYLLTLAYDSDKDVRERLFRDIQPDEFYPVYGDSAVRGFDAQSTARLYVRVDKGKSYLMYGDFTTQTVAEARKLSQLTRSLTGIRQHIESGTAVINAFASNESSRQIVEELPANGTSGPFQLRTGGGLINSERVEILTRDRHQPAVILKVEPKARFSDYEIETFAGRVLFKAPIPSLDIELNPISIRITYEVEQGGERFWMGGFDAQVRLTDSVEVGANFVHDDNPQSRFRMGGVNATVRLAERTSVIAELAATDRDASAADGVATSGRAGRVELRHEDGNLQARAYAGRAGAGFDNPSSLLSKGREEAGAKVTYRIDPKISLSAEALRTVDTQTQGERDALALKLERALTSTTRLEVGMRRSHETAAPAQFTSPTAASPGAAPVDFTSVRAKLTAQVPRLPQASVFGEVEQDVEDHSKKLAAIGGEYQFSQRGKLYGRHQFISSLGSSFALNSLQRSHTSVLGIDTEYAKDANLFSEYRARDAFDGRSAEAAIGLRNSWTLAPGLRFNTSSERVHTFSGTENGSRAITGAIEYTANPLWKGSARLELRESTQSDSVLASVGLAAKAGRDWTLLGRTVLSHTFMNGTATGERIQERYQLGVAYRDTDTNVWNALARVERRNEEDTTQPGLTLKRALDFFTFQLNYQPERAWVLSGRYATKWVTEDSLGLASAGRTQLVSGRATFDLTPRWDIGLVASLYGTESFGQRQSGLGLELGYMVERNLWLSVGYNLFGFKDRDLAGMERLDRGVYVRLRYKFDEDLFEPSAARSPYRLNEGGTGTTPPKSGDTPLTGRGRP